MMDLLKIRDEAQDLALNLGMKVSDEKEKRFKEIAEIFYENSDKNISKEEYIKSMITIQKRDELSDLFMAKVIKKFL
ncbi:hypothetical protein D3C72_2238250 [compost metagenome]